MMNPPGGRDGRFGPSVRKPANTPTDSAKLSSRWAWPRARLAMRRGLLLGVCVVALAACSPTFDWRELRLQGLPMTFMLPAKPARMTREVTLDERRLAMEMAGAQAGGMTFTAAWVDLRGAAPGSGHGERILDAMVTGMLRNIGAATSRQQTVSVAVLDTRDNSRRTIDARRVIASGSHDGRPLVMLAVFAALPTQAHQFVVMGETVDEEVAGQFLDSVRLTALAPKAGS